MSKFRYAAVALIYAFLAGCAPDLAIDEGARILCGEDGVCPEGFVCRPAIGRCLPVEGLDAEPPAVSEAAIEPAIGGVGTEFVVTVTATHALLEPPQAVAEIRTDRLPLLLDEEASDAEADRWVFRYRVTGAEPEGVATVLLDMIDRHGNVAVAVPAGTFAFDFTPPEVISADVVPAVAKRGATLVVVAHVSEPLRAPPVLSVTPPLDFDEPEPLGLGTWSWRRVVTAEDGAATHHVSISMEDLAGNAGDAADVATFEIDATLPIVEVESVGPEFVRDGVTVTAVFTSDKPLDEIPQVALGTHAMDVDDSEAPRYTAAYTMAPGDDEGVHPVVAQVVDRATNVVSEALGHVYFDRTPPAVVPGTAALRYVPAPDNPLTSVDRAREGTVVEVGFTLSEPIADGTDPVVRTTDESLSFGLVSHTGLHWVYRATVPAGIAEGAHMIEVLATDRAGNAGRDDVIAFDVDHTPPAAPQVDAPDRIVYRRVPWGIADTDHEPLFTVEGAAGAVKAGATVRIHAPGPNASEIGRTRADGDGAFGPVLLWGSDRPYVLLSAVDGAGNPSEIVEVRDVAWTASLVGKAAPTTGGNPTVLVTTPRLEGSTIQALGTQPATAEDYERAAGIRPGGLRIETRARWEAAIGPDGSPTRRENLPLAYDARRGRAVMFSGVIPFGGGHATGTFEWNGHAGTWILRETPSHPTPRQDHGMAFDASRGETVLFGGYNGGSIYREGTWTWDGVVWSRRDATGDPAPALRRNHAMVYDPDREVVLLFGGRTGNTVYDDVWEWDGATETWTDRSPTMRPPARSHHAMAWDPVHRRILVYGGLPDEGDALGDLWAWDGATGTWTELTEVESPVGRAGATMVTDLSRQQIVLYGGRRGLVQYQGTWIWDCVAEDWTLLEPRHRPPTSHPHAMAFDDGRGRVVLFDPTLTTGFDTARTFELDLDLPDWIERTPEAPLPSARHRHAMTADPTTGEIVLFGGHVGSATRSDETWLWTGGRWTQVTPETAPSGREYHTMVSDTVRGRVLLFGGFSGGSWLNDLWAWDGTSRSWSLLPAATRPPERTDAAMAFDADRRRVVLFGGHGADGVEDDTWEWDVDDEVWLPRSPATRPPARRAHAMAWDADRGRVVLFGGRTGAGLRLQDTWEWDGTDWVLRSPDEIPLARQEHALVWDPFRRQVVLVGGSAASQLGDVWVWNGQAATWTQIEPAEGDVTLPPRGRHAAAWDPRTRSLLVHGGAAGFDRLEDTWRWDGAGRHRPGMTWTVPLSAIGEAVMPHALDARLDGGGAGRAPGDTDPTPGAVLLAWDTRLLGWRTARENTAGPDAADPDETGLLRSVDDQVALRSFIHGPDRTIVLAVAPLVAAGGQDPSVVVLRGAELTVHYRR